MKLPLQFEATTTRAEFARLLPAAVGYADFVEDGDSFVHREGARSWRIRFTALPDLRLGLIRLGRHRVEFEFQGHTAEEIAAFMEKFELHFRRGGG
jgi:hypothetical protein